MLSPLLQQSIRRALRPAASSLRAAYRPPAFGLFATQRAQYATASPNNSESFLQGSSANYVDEMYRAWRHDPSSVHLSWQTYFKNIAGGAPPGQAYQAPPTLVPGSVVMPAGTAIGGAAAVKSATSQSDDIFDHLKVQLLVRAYQMRGHHLARLDPLGILDADLDSSFPQELEIENYGFTAKDLDREITLGPGMLPGFITYERPTMKLREIIEHLKEIYCGSIGIEYCHIPDRNLCNWIRQRIEIPTRYRYSVDEKRMILDRLIWSDSFERFVASKFPSEKRFGLEGCESLIPGMKALIDRSVDLGIRSIVMGMPHRGRLNVLSNVVRKQNESIFCEFSGVQGPSEVEGSGDVKYHLGMNYDRPTPSGKRVHLSLEANPSHLEAVDPVVLGKTRALQFYAGDEPERTHSMGVLMHGDAAFAAQGVVYETLGMSDLPSYTTGGTIHVVVNNQIGFTTDPRFARSTPYCTDVAKVVNAPVFHVNGDDVEAVVFVCQLAAEWRQTFKKDVVVDIVCYRKQGHNETDQPSFTQPLMYRKIKEQKPALQLYEERLLNEGSFTADEIKQMKDRVWKMLEESYSASKNYEPTPREWMASIWNGFKSPRELANETTRTYPTGAPRDMLEHIGRVISSYPNDFNVHPNLARILKTRRKTIDEGANIDWPTAEALAFGSLLMEGKHVRLSGQDVERGTFSQRHAVLHNQDNEQQYISLGRLDPQQAPFTICNSSLSEFGALGYEYGYSLVSPNALVMWEAQFGDFANNAQCIIDQFIASGEKKWLQRTGLTMLLPHGYDGQGPEHSSGRIERFLQLCDDNPYHYPTPEKLARQHQDCNMQVVYASTPANYFHALRRQLFRDFRKPMIVFTSKSLLRHPLARSTLAEMTDETIFRRYIPEEDVKQELVANDKIRRHILCSGQVYYKLVQAREQRGIKDVAISRVEQISPFPYDLIKPHLDQYPNAEIFWCQEEPLNFGAWTYVEPRIITAMQETQHHNKAKVSYAGRGPTGAVATGKKKLHLKQEEMILDAALS
ncbi:putative Oxoglutarate dehydrogenase [Syncephalis fuscata]|nr:putative Oxoglutarate dehydrogenase [Syncephalis fuscata]